MATVLLKIHRNPLVVYTSTLADATVRTGGVRHSDAHRQVLESERKNGGRGEGGGGRGRG